ncbi:MAG: hypothetical protein WHV61_03960 [Burkholderiales bacterium]
MTNRFARWLLVLLGSLLAAAATAASAQDYPALAARYQESRVDGHAGTHRGEWFFLRQTDQVELGRGAYVELWQRDARDEVSWQRIFHDERKLIAYTPGELRTQRRAVAWRTLNTIIDAGLLASLQPMGRTRYLGRQATRYRGRVDGEAIEVVWLDTEKLPGRVVRQKGETRYELRLKELRAQPDSRWPRADLARAADYEFIDGADLGDREYDPFVRRVLAVDARNGLTGHQH